MIQIKRIILAFLILMALDFAVSETLAQVACPICCQDEHFPYTFCPNTQGPELCRSDATGAAKVGYLPDPNCPTPISGAFPSVGISQPNSTSPIPGPKPVPSAHPSNPGSPGPEPSPDDLDAFGDPKYPDGDSDPGYRDDLAAWSLSDGHKTQWDADNTDWTTEPSEPANPGAAPDPSDLITYPGGDTDPQYIIDLADWKDKKGAHDQWATDDGWWNSQEKPLVDWIARDAAVTMTTVWDDAAAVQDVTDALNGWYGICTLSGHSDCCITIILDPNGAFWGNSNNYSLGGSFSLGRTPVFPTGCPEEGCSSRAVHVNVTDNFLFESNVNPPGPDPNYPGRNIADRSWFTGTSVPDVASGMQDFSFHQLMEHEIGHWLGLHHPNGDPGAQGGVPAGQPCDNNITNIPSCGESSVMQQGKNIPNQTPMPIQCEDKNMFRKLYCPGTSCEQCGGSTTCTHLSVNFQESAFDAEIFPNPSTGSTMLRFSLKKSSSVQVIIVDMLGRTIATADEREQNVGENWLRLPTSQLPSGQYVCRIKAADGEESINFIIQK